MVCRGIIIHSLLTFGCSNRPYESFYIRCSEIVFHNAWCLVLSYRNIEKKQALLLVWVWLEVSEPAILIDRDPCRNTRGITTTINLSEKTISGHPCICSRLPSTAARLVLVLSRITSTSILKLAPKYLATFSAANSRYRQQLISGPISRIGTSPSPRRAPSTSPM